MDFFYDFLEINEIIIQKYFDELLKLKDYFHQYPEIQFQLLKFLDKIDMLLTLFTQLKVEIVFLDERELQLL